MLGQLNEAEPPNDIILRIGNHLVTESSKLTPALVGEKFVEPALIDYKGKKCLVFVFGVRSFYLLPAQSVEGLTSSFLFVPIPILLIKCRFPTHYSSRYRESDRPP